MARATQLAETARTQPRSGGSNGEAKGEEAPAARIPFIAASRDRMEPFHDDVKTLTGSSAQVVSNVDVPAIGFLAEIELLVEATGGAAGAATVASHEDAPWNVLQQLSLADVNGNPLFFPMSGFNAKLVQKYGAYSFVTDPAELPSFADVDTDGNFAFVLKLPVWISPRDGLGCLANMNASQTYKISYSLAAANTVYTTQPDTLPDVRVRGWIHVLTQPRPQAVDGSPQATEPPNHGTTQYQSFSVFNLSGGNQTIRLPRVGNIVRTLIAVMEDSNGDRSDDDFPDATRLEFDGNLMEDIHKTLHKDRMADQWGFTAGTDVAGGVETGVFVWGFTYDLDGKAGFENRQKYLHTTQASRLDLVGEFGANAAKLSIITNDIAVPA